MNASFFQISQLQDFRAAAVQLSLYKSIYSAHTSTGRRQVGIHSRPFACHYSDDKVSPQTDKHKQQRTPFVAGTTSIITNNRP